MRKMNIKKDNKFLFLSLLSLIFLIISIIVFCFGTTISIAKADSIENSNYETDEQSVLSSL